MLLDSGGTSLSLGLAATTLLLLLLYLFATHLSPKPSVSSQQLPHSQDSQKQPFSQDLQDLDVWIIAGQSNAVGNNGPDGQPIPPYSQPFPNHTYMFTSSQLWAPAVPNIHVGVHGYADADSVGPDMAFARTLVQQGGSGGVGLVPTAKDGTGMEQWAPGGELYGFMVQQAHGAMRGAPGARLRGMIWVQGESDAINETDARQYNERFTQFVKAVRAELCMQYHTQLPIILAVMATEGREVRWPFIRLVREQQQQLQLPHLLKVDMAGHEFFREGVGQHAGLVHMTKHGISAFGTALAYVYLQYSRGQAVQAGAGGRTAAEAGSTDVWLLGGQSNAVGENAEDGLPIPNCSLPYPADRVLMFTPGLVWQDAVPNVHMGFYGYKDQDSVGPEMSFARALLDANVSSRVALVPGACGATPLAAWLPSSSLYQQLVERTRQGLQALLGREPKARVRGLIWVQGESDGLEEEPALAYASTLTSMLKKLRVDVSQPQLHIIMVVMSSWDRTLVFPFLDIVREQQQQMELDNLVKVDMQGYEFFMQQYPPGPRGPIHLTKSAQGAMGATMAHQYMDCLAQGKCSP